MMGRHQRNDEQAPEWMGAHSFGGAIIPEGWCPVASGERFEGGDYWAYPGDDRWRKREGSSVGKKMGSAWHPTIRRIPATQPAPEWLGSKDKIPYGWERVTGETRDGDWLDRAQGGWIKSGAGTRARIRVWIEDTVRQHSYVPTRREIRDRFCVGERVATQELVAWKKGQEQ